MNRFVWFVVILLSSTCLLLAEGKSEDKEDAAIQRKVAGLKSGTTKGSDTVRVIVQTKGDPDAQGVSSHIGKLGGQVLQKFNTFNGAVAELPAQSLEAVASDPAVSRVSLDEEVISHQTSSTSMPNFTPAQIASFLSTFDNNRNTTGAPEAWFKYGTAGQGIDVAVIDSGIAAVADLPNVIKTVDFTAKPTPGQADPFGHGTHVAGILAGNGQSSNYKYPGIAPWANLVNLRVLDQNGSAYTSTVIKAIEWAITNRNAKVGGDKSTPMNIRVLNLSLGHAPLESAANDPLTLACRQAVAAGIVVVVSAGNNGDNGGNPVFGGINSPGTEPSVITVGAMTTWDTVSRGDDTLASYSSRGPTIDGLIKPDIVAPGSRIVSDLSPGSTLARKYPVTLVNSYYMRLSGTSMSAPFVAGTAALILSKNPGLTPNAVKAILMYTAERRDTNPLDMGAGYLNVLGALDLAANINTATSVGQYWILNSGTGLTYLDTSLTGNTIAWGETIVWDDSLYSSGTNMFYNQLAWGTTITWGDTIVWDETIVWDTSATTMNSLVAGQTIIWDENNSNTNSQTLLRAQ